MGELKRVHEYEVHPKTGRARLKRVNPTRVFVQRGEPKVLCQNGEWFSSGGKGMVPTTVPSSFRENIKEHPLIPGTSRAGEPAYMRTCRYCPAERSAVLSTEYERHLEEVHIGLPQAERKGALDAPRRVVQAEPKRTGVRRRKASRRAKPRTIKGITPEGIAPKPSPKPE